MINKKRKPGRKKKINLEDAENLSIYEVGSEAEDLSSAEEGKDMMSEGDFDDSNILSRVRLF